MPQNTKDFIQDWLRENINAEAYQSDGSARARDLADQCRQDAAAEGLSTSDIDAAARDMIGGGDSLETLISDVIEKTTNAAVKRQADDDD